MTPLPLYFLECFLFSFHYLIIFIKQFIHNLLKLLECIHILKTVSYVSGILNFSEPTALYMWPQGILHRLCSSVLRNKRSNWDGLEPWELKGYTRERKAESATRFVKYLGNISQFPRKSEKTGPLGLSTTGQGLKLGNGNCRAWERLKITCLFPCCCGHLDFQ